LFSLDSAAVQNEIRAIRKLCNGTHENLVTVLNVGEFPDKTFAFIDMELCDLTLHDLNQGHWSPRAVDTRTPELALPSELWSIMKQIANGLAFIHSNNEVHRDLKPQNGLTGKSES
jgi:serine/threonine protein kinase